MKILFLGDYSNLHGCLGAELRRRGHHVTVVSDGGAYMRTAADIRLERRPGALGSLSYLLKSQLTLSRLRGYDVVQLINPGFLSLRPSRLRGIFDRIRNNNGRIFLTLAGNDHFFVKACCQTDMFRFSEFRADGRPTPAIVANPDTERGWLVDELASYTRHVYDNVDGAMAVLPEYEMAARPVLGDRVGFTNIPVDLSNVPYSSLDVTDRVRFFIGIRSRWMINKGTDRLLSLLQDLERDMPDRCEVVQVSDVSLEEYLRLMRNSHIVVDQLYSYSPATNALQAMALGRVAASGGQPEYYASLSGWDGGQPVISLQPSAGLDDIRERLGALVADPSPLREMSVQGRRLVERYNDVSVVADAFLAQWEGRRQS